MSTTTGNIKISQLEVLDLISSEDELRIPVSKAQSNAGNPDWDSYSITTNVLSDFMETSLGLSDGDSEKGLKSKVNDLETTANEYLELEKRLGKYNLVSNKVLTVSASNMCIKNSGEKTDLNGYSISKEVSLEQGNLYLLKVNGILHSDVAIMAKVNEYRDNTQPGNIRSEFVYEPLPNHYHQYGTPVSSYLVFFATENKNVVISMPSINFSNNDLNKLYAVKYGAFVDIADNLLSINGELMKVIVEAIVKNRKDIDSLYESTKSLGDIHVNSIDSDEFPCVQGEPMVVVADRAPGEKGTTHGDDIPNRIGQIWVNKANGVAYIAIALGSILGWKPITSF